MTRTRYVIWTVVHRLGEDVAARDAHVVVRARCRGTPAGRPPPGPRSRRRAGPRPRGPARIVTRRHRRQSFAELPGEVLDQRVEHAGDDALAHRRGLAGDLRVGVDRAAAVGERERDVAFA